MSFLAKLGQENLGQFKLGDGGNSETIDSDIITGIGAITAIESYVRDLFVASPNPWTGVPYVGLMIDNIQNSLFTGLFGAESGVMLWKGDWAAGVYHAGHVVREGGAIYMATEQTSTQPPNAEWEEL